MNSNKISKYIHKYEYSPSQIYFNKIVKYISLYGGNSTNIKGTNNFIPGDIDSLLNYLKYKLSDNAKYVSKNKYLIILYGPPASGKTIARKIAFQLIKKYFDEDLSIEDLLKTAIDTGLDEITYDAVVDGDTISNKLITAYKNNIKHNFNGKSDNELKMLIKKHINDFSKSSNDIYYKNRQNELSEMLFYIATFLNKNIYFEISGGSSEYVIKMINTFKYYNYIPVIIYPFINNIDVLFERSVIRGTQDGRFLTCGDIEQKAISSKKDYKLIKKFMNKQNKYLHFQYNANFDRHIYDEYSDNNLSNIDNIISNYNLEIKVVFNKLLANRKSKYIKDETNIIKRCNNIN